MLSYLVRLLTNPGGRGRVLKTITKAVVMAALFCALPLVAQAAGLGRLTLLSALGQPLNAEVEIVSFREAPGRDAVNEPAASTVPAMSTREPVARAQTTPQTRPTSTVEPAQPQTDTPATPKPENVKGELPRTASAMPLLALIGVLALCSGFILTAARRRRAV